MENDGGATANANDSQPSWMSTILRFLAIYYAINFFSSKLMSPSTTPASNTILPSSDWHLGMQELSLSIYINESPVFEETGQDPVWNISGIEFGAYQSKASHDIVVSPSDNVLANNGSLWAHVFLYQQNSIKSSRVLVLRKRLNYYLPRKKNPKTRKLMLGDDNQDESSPDLIIDEEEPDSDSWVSYWWPNVFPYCF